jgi:hypothetical protein
MIRRRIADQLNQPSRATQVKQFLNEAYFTKFLRFRMLREILRQKGR